MEKYKPKRMYWSGMFNFQLKYGTGARHYNQLKLQ